MPVNAACLPALAAIPGLVSWWKLDEGGIGTATDSAGANHAAHVGSSPDEAAGAAPVSCDGGLSYQYGAFPGRHRVAGTTTLDLTGPFTLLAWANYPYPDIEEGIMSKGHAYALAKLGGGGLPDTTHPNCLALNVQKSSTLETITRAGDTPLAIDTDYFLAGVFTGTAIRLYVNGQYDGGGAAVFSGAAPEGTGEQFSLGFDITGNSYTWARLDNVAVVSGALSDAQILALYNACRCAIVTARARQWEVM